MRRTGKAPVSPITGSAACGGAGMTKVEAIMTKSSSVGQRELSLGGGADRGEHRRAHVALLQPEERSIAAAAAQQIVMPAALDDFAGLDHQNGIGMHDGVQPVCDD